MAKNLKEEEIKVNYKLIIGICILIILTIFIVADFNSNRDNNFKNSCNSLYGEGNWTEYLADSYFSFHSDTPMLFRAGHSYTCFKTGTIP